ncbi:MAG: XRE family transcriptional regulator [bacterium]
MKTSVRIHLNNPALLTWARESGGYSVEELAEYLKRSPDTICAWERGEEAPTYNQLSHIANKLKRPLAAFFLPIVPKETPLPVDHRLMPRRGTGEFAPATRIAFRAVLTQLRETRELLDDLSRPIVFSLPLWSINSDPDQEAIQLREKFQTSIGDQLNRLKSHYQAMDHWRSILFDYGVITRICTMSPEDARAFCLLDSNLAGIGLSNEEREHVRIFSLFHELAHLGTMTPGVSGQLQRNSNDISISSKKIEEYCDRFAAAFLLPPNSSEVRNALFSISGNRITRERAEKIGEDFHVSKYVVARRALDLGLITKEIYWDEVTAWNQVDIIIVEQKKKRNKELGHHGGSVVNTNISYAGKRFAGLVLQALDQQRITIHQASQMLSLNPKALGELREEAMW